MKFKTLQIEPYIKRRQYEVTGKNCKSANDIFIAVQLLKKVIMCNEYYYFDDI